jgi:hypothetical protein
MRWHQLNAVSSERPTSARQALRCRSQAGHIETDGRQRRVVRQTSRTRAGRPDAEGVCRANESRPRLPRTHHDRSVRSASDERQSPPAVSHSTHAPT